MSVYLPTMPDISVFLALLAVISGVTLVGRAAFPSQPVPGGHLAAGGGLLALLFTVGGVAGLSFYVMAWGFGVLAIVAAALCLRRGVAPNAKLLLVSLCLAVLVVAVLPKAPSEVDEFTHWLPNAAYVASHHRFPALDSLPAASAHPAFPYNLAYLVYLTSLLTGGFAELATSQFNVLLLVLLAAIILHVLRTEGPGQPLNGDRRGVVMGLAVIAALIAVPFNPTFVPRIVLTSYGDMATGVFLAVAALILNDLLARTKAGVAATATALQLGLALALTVNLKQANLVLVVLIVFAGAVAAASEGRHVLGRFLTLLPCTTLPFLVVYAAWRWHVSNDMPPGSENEIRPIAQWQIHALPEILGSIAEVFFKKAAYTIAVLVAGAAAIVGLRRRERTSLDRLSLVFVVLFAGYAAFLLFTYVAHFVGESGRNAQSFWRYQTQLGPLLMIVVALCAARWLRRGAQARPVLVIAGGGLLLWALPVVFIEKLRFDLHAPKPYMRQIATELKTGLGTAPLSVIIPGDNGDQLGLFRYLLADEGRIVRTSSGHAADLATAREAAHHVWLYCATDALEAAFGIALPDDASILLAREGSQWRPVKSWPYPVPPGMKTRNRKFAGYGCENDT